eukprot:1172952-Prorocentrum_minimum.AAC.1
MDKIGSLDSFEERTDDDVPEPPEDTNEKLTPLNQAQNGRDAHLDLLCRYQSLCRCGAHALLNPCECKQAERQFDRAGLFLCGYGAFSRDSGNTGANAAQLQVDGISL